MSFKTPLRVEKYRETRGLGRARWRLLAPLVFESKVMSKTIVVPEGYETDFASVPRLPLAFLLTGDTGHASAVIHDYLVDTVVTDSESWDRAAEVFAEALRAEGVPSWRVSLMAAGVRVANRWSRAES